MRLIDADKLKAYFTENFTEVWHYTGVRAVIDIAPTIEAEPVRHGRWKETSHNNYYLCSECNYAPWLDDEFPNKTPYYCPSCGAKMDEVPE